jgi:hypothetical protein
VIVGRTIKKPPVNAAARRPVAQRFGESAGSRSAANSDYGQMTTVLEAVDFEDDRVAGLPSTATCGVAHGEQRTRST